MEKKDLKRSMNSELVSSLFVFILIVELIQAERVHPLQNANLIYGGAFLIFLLFQDALYYWCLLQNIENTGFTLPKWRRIFKIAKILDVWIMVLYPFLLAIIFWSLFSSHASNLMGLLFGIFTMIIAVLEFYKLYYGFKKPSRLSIFLNEED